MAQAPGPQVETRVEIDAAADRIAPVILVVVVQIGVVTDEGGIDPLYPLIRPDIIAPDPAKVGLGQAEITAQAGKVEGKAGSRHQGIDLDAILCQLRLH